MKKNHVIVFVSSLMFCACAEDSMNTTGTSALTAEVGKIETRYSQGDVEKKPTNGPKIETLMGKDELEKFYSKLNNRISADRGDKRDKYQIASTLFDGYDVGVIPNANQCPSWSEKIVFNMDCEDSGGITGWDDNSTVTSDDYRGSWTTHNTDVTMVFCRVDGRFFNNPAGTYKPSAVLKLGTLFTGMGEIVRFFDNEDSSNSNTYSGDIGPNYMDGNTTLRFASLTSYGSGGCCAPYPDFSFGYGLLGSGGYYGNLLIDDEDRRNANGLSYRGVNTDHIDNFLYGGGNTRIFITRARE
ncbi:hypothetical protein KK062_09270 [Fulvivirgaceae bacterium PWU5]|uniref:Uncharacterized protein n=1 Tax=Dawidia cretensis TaxID=2782350 RepID=A0AAP2DW01_9BACT|nr:hypothetical protein [Dawidia cretensis]MBT1708413.1 hypothetical protein [Dawidia cretensis]